MTTADFTCVRRHGPDGRYRCAYPAPAIERLAAKAQSWAAEGKDAFIYFNNDYAGHAVTNASQLLEAISP